LKNLIKAYKALSIIEIFLLTGVLVHVAVFIAKSHSQYLDLIFVFIVFLVPVFISWKTLSLTSKNQKANETLLIIGHIFNFIKAITLLAVFFGGICFFIETNQSISVYNEKGSWYYLFFLFFLLFVIVSTLTFITCFGISKSNPKMINTIIHSIDNLKD